MVKEQGWPTGFRLEPRAEGPAPELVQAFRTVPAAHASDALGRHVGARELRAYHGDLSLTMCGPALTVRVRPGDNLMLHLAVLEAQPGDVLVVDGGGDVSTALVGGLMRTLAIARGIAGFVVDGALRDVAEWAQGEIAIYARGHTHRGPGKDGPGEINVPVACAGLAVNPGDLILGDADGVVAIPAAEAAELLPVCRAIAEREAAVEARHRAGQANREYFLDLLRSKGCPV